MAFAQITYSDDFITGGNIAKIAVQAARGGESDVRWLMEAILVFKIFFITTAIIFIILRWFDAHTRD